MSNRLQIWWETLRTSLWPVPVAMLVVAFLLREAASVIDGAVANREALQIWWLHSGSGDDARNLLSTLVSALITMASVMFSITMVVLSLALTSSARAWCASTWSTSARSWRSASS